MADAAEKSPIGLKQPHGLSPRIQWLRDYYFRGVQRAWNNEWSCWSTGTPWDVCYDELHFYIVPENYAMFDALTASMLMASRDVPLPSEFWSRSLVERRAWFIREVVVNQLPQEILPGDLIAGARFNLMASRCYDGKEARRRAKKLAGVRSSVKWFHEHGYGNAGATSGHLIPDFARVLRDGFRGIHADLQEHYDRLASEEQAGDPGRQLRAMMTAAEMPRELAARYAGLCLRLAADEQDAERAAELEQMARNLDRVPWEPARTFWEAIQSLWLTHMLIMSDECYPGPGDSFGRVDQYLLPYWQTSVDEGMDPEFGKEILKCFWVHANTAYDAMIQVGGNQGITAGFGQLITLSGCGKDGEDLTNDLTMVMLEVIDEMNPILEPKPNVRLHRNTPEALLDKVVDMVASCQGAPFLLNFDERSMAGMLREARLGGYTDKINLDNVHEYAPVGCLENTMVGNDRSGTVDCNLNLLKAVELALGGGKDLVPALDPLTQQELSVSQDGPDTWDPRGFVSWERFWDAYALQTRHIVERCVDLYELSEELRAEFSPTPYLSCLVRGCADKALDITRGGPEIKFVTVEGVTFATTVDALLAIKYLVYDEQRCSMDELVGALRANWDGHDKLQAWARFRAPKYGRNHEEADAMAQAVMELWTDEVWKHRTRSTDRQFRPGMLSWNYWVGDGYIMAASADGRPRGQFLSNAICPSNGADIEGPTANANSVGVALGGHAGNGDGDFEDWVNLLPNGASHTITFSPSMLRDAEHRENFKAFLRGYCRNGGTALQINVLDPEVLREAQRRPQDYRHLLVRITGYNAYFSSIGRELQDEIIARETHERM